jgi:sugar lactone lactonase YvrE
MSRRAATIVTRWLIATTLALFGAPATVGATTRPPATLALAPLQTYAGTGVGGYNGDGLARSQTQLSTPQGVATDAAGDLFVVDTGNNRIREIASDGTVSTVAGDGVAGYTGDGVAASAAGLSYPNDVAVDAAGDIFIADTSAHRVREVTSDGIIHTVAGDGVPGATGDGGPATQAELNQPVDVALDGRGDLFISDGTTNSVREVTPDGIIHTFAGTGAAAYNGDGIPASRANVNDPTGLAIDASGDVFFTDTGDHRVREVTPDGIIHTIAGTGLSGYLGDHGLATYAELAAPVALALDAQGDLFVGDIGNGTVRVITGGVIVTLAGTGTPGASGDGMPGALSQLDWPMGVAVDAAGELFVADSYVNRVRELG